VVEIPDSKYPQSVVFEVSGDRTSLLDGINIGDTVKVTWNLRGREWKSPQGEVKYFTTLSAWRVEVTAKSAVATGSTGGGADDQLPF
jgi:hypothetical protein